MADADPKVRDQATFNLMGISADDLPRLRQIVSDTHPIMPAQGVALHEIVQQAYLASLKYTFREGSSAETDPNGSEGPYFLGILWPPGSTETDARLGAAVDVRIPGFPSYRYLRKGDMILGIFFNPDAPLIQYPNIEIHSRDILSKSITRDGAPVPQNIVLEVLRDGETIRVPLKMAPRPLDANPFNMGSLYNFISVRQQQADTYWNLNFAPLVADDQTVAAD